MFYTFTLKSLFIEFLNLQRDRDNLKIIQNEEGEEVYYEGQDNYITRNIDHIPPE